MTKDSTGTKAISYLYSYQREAKSIETRKRNGVPINIKTCKSDLEIIDFLAERFSVTRNWIISFLVESDINDMLKVFDTKPRYELAIEADKEISKKKLPHDFRGKTWEWDVLQPDHEVFNPANKGIKK